MNDDTIAAIATPIGSGGIGIIKISGKDAFSIAEAIFQRSRASLDGVRSEGDALSFPLNSHRLYLGHIVNPDTGKVLDEVLLSVMKAPRTYTRENVVEINTHSGFIVMTSILDLVIQKGARLADPGEFTKRAFLSGRIDLTQAEAVIDIINSRTEKSLEIATSQIKGDLKNRIESIRRSMIDILTQIEAAIDFSEDVEDVFDLDIIRQTLDKRVINALSELVEQYKNAHYLRDGLKMVVIGRPNVGKSSLMNRLIQEDRVIVTPIPGTTRDLIEETLNIHGIPVILADSAGLHETKDPVEVIGIEKTRTYIRASDLVLFMIDANEPFTREDQKIYETIDDKQLILIINKIDLVENGVIPEIPETWGPISNIKISALYGTGLNSLKDFIAKLVIGDQNLEIQNTIIPNLRHKIALEESFEFAVSSREQICQGSSLELVAMDIKDALDSLGKILGDAAKADVIEQIFNRFCIGK